MVSGEPRRFFQTEKQTVMIGNDGRKRYSVPALKKGLLIMEYLSDRAEARTMTQIARDTGYKLTEIQRILDFLTTEGYIRKNSLRAYYLSDKLYRIAIQTPSSRHLLAYSIPPMEKFVQETRESIHLVVLMENMVNVIGQIEGLGISRLSIRLGSYPAHLSTSGLLMLSQRPGFKAEQLGLESREEELRISRLINKMRKDGYGFNESFYTKGTFDLSVLVTLQGHNTLAAMATSFLLPKDTNLALRQIVRKYLARLRECVAEIVKYYE